MAEHMIPVDRPDTILAPDTALYLGRHAPLGRAVFPDSLRAPQDAPKVILRTMASGLRGTGTATAGAHAPQTRLSYTLPAPPGDRVRGERPRQVLSGRLHFQGINILTDTLITQMPSGDVFVSDFTAPEAARAVAQSDTARVSLTPPDAEGFLARFAHNQLSAGARAHCFCTGTFIYTPRGPVPVEDMRVGYPVRTLDYGVQPVRWIGTTLHSEPRAHAPIEIAAGALGHGFPASTLRVSPYHRLCLRSSIAERMFGTPEVLLSARFLLDVPGVHQISGEIPVRYWHIATARHCLVNANGTWAETLFPGLSVPTGMDASDVSQLEVVFDQKLARGTEETATTKPPVRPVLRGAAQRAFVARHLKQRRAFVSHQINDGEDEDVRVSVG
jgi:hypothetical protein